MFQGYIDHIYNSWQWSQWRRSLKDGDIYLNLASNERIVVQVVEDVTLILEMNCLLKLKNYLYIPKSRKNLILVSSLCKSNYIVFFNNQVIIKMNDLFICSGSLVDNLYHMTLLSLFPSNENNHISLKRKEPNTNQTYLWHLHLSHINLYKIQRLVKS